MATEYRYEGIARRLGGPEAPPEMVLRLLVGKRSKYVEVPISRADALRTIADLGQHLMSIEAWHARHGG